VTHPPVVLPPPYDLAPAQAILEDFQRLQGPTADDAQDARHKLETALKGASAKDAELIWTKFYWAADQRAEALTHVDQAIKADPKLAAAHLWRARILLRDYLRLRSNWERAVQLPSLLLGVIGGQKNSIRDAVEMSRLVTEGRESLDRFRALAPESGSESAFAEGVQMFYSNENEKAETSLQTATDSSYLSRDAYLVLGIVQTFLHKYEEADRTLVRARGERADYLLVRAMLALHMLVELTQAPMSEKEIALLGHLRVLLEAEPEPAKWDWLTDKFIRDRMTPYIKKAQTSTGS
jgi:hypothetical protein